MVTHLTHDRKKSSSERKILRNLRFYIHVKVKQHAERYERADIEKDKTIT